VATRSFVPSARRLLTNPYNKQYFYIALNGDRGRLRRVTFEWDDEKDRENQKKHSVSFAVAQRAFLDPKRVIAQDVKHSSEEDRFYCIGRVEDGILTVRFTYRGHTIRIFGAGYWRQGKVIYEDQNKVH
jgi:uncharacterized DUF497 family protein